MSPSSISYVSQNGIRWALRQGIIHNFRPAVRLVLMCMGSHADPSGWTRPGNWTLMAETGLEIRSIRRILEQLVTYGVIEKSRYRHHGQTLQGYHLQLWKALSEIDCAEAQPPQKRTLSASMSPSTADSESEKTDSESEKTDSESAKDSTVHQGREWASGDAAPAAPPHPTPGCGESQEPAEQLSREDPEQGRSRPPQPADLVEAYNGAVEGSGLVMFQSEITRPVAVMLTNAIKHRALEGHIEAWKRYCTWATQDPFLSGEREGGYPANLRQLCKSDVIDRWATAAKPRLNPYARFVVDETYTPVCPEADDPNRRWNAKTKTWDYVQATPLGPDGPTVEPGVVDMIQAMLEEDWQEQEAQFGLKGSSTPLRRIDRGVG